jgi:hypothetical protein
VVWGILSLTRWPPAPSLSGLPKRLIRVRRRTTNPVDEIFHEDKPVRTATRARPSLIHSPCLRLIPTQKPRKGRQATKSGLVPTLDRKAAKVFPLLLRCTPGEISVGVDISERPGHSVDRSIAGKISAVRLRRIIGRLALPYKEYSTCGGAIETIGIRRCLNGSRP